MQRRQRDPRLQPGQWRTQTVVDAVAEGEVPAVGAVDVERLRVAVARVIPVRRRQRHDDLREGGDDDPAEQDLLGRVAEGRVRHRRVEAHALLDRPRHEVGVGHEGVALLGVAQQGDGPVADQAGGGVVSGDDQLEDRGEQLLLRQCTVALRGDDEVGHQVHARLRALAVEQRGEVAGDAVRGRHGRGRRLRPGVRGEQVGEPAAQVGPVRFRDPEQLADHRERQREREARHQVHRLVRTAGRQSRRAGRPRSTGSGAPVRRLASG